MQARQQRASVTSNGLSPAALGTLKGLATFLRQYCIQWSGGVSIAQNCQGLPKSILQMQTTAPQQLQSRELDAF